MRRLQEANFLLVCFILEGNPALAYCTISLLLSTSSLSGDVSTHRALCILSTCVNLFTQQSLEIIIIILVWRLKGGGVFKSVWAAFCQVGHLRMAGSALMCAYTLLNMGWFLFIADPNMRLHLFGLLVVCLFVLSFRGGFWRRRRPSATFK